MKKQLYIGGEWVDSCSSVLIPVINPSTEQVFDYVAAANEEDIFLCVIKDFFL